MAAETFGFWSSLYEHISNYQKLKWLLENCAYDSIKFKISSFFSSFFLLMLYWGDHLKFWTFPYAALWFDIWYLSPSYLKILYLHAKVKEEDYFGIKRACQFTLDTCKKICLKSTQCYGLHRGYNLEMPHANLNRLIISSLENFVWRCCLELQGAPNPIAYSWVNRNMYEGAEISRWLLNEGRKHFIVASCIMLQKTVLCITWVLVFV